MSLTHRKFFYTLCFLLFFLLCTISRVTFSSPLESINAEKHIYFSKLNLLPILYPKNEVPGDVYARPNGDFLYRKDQCLDSIETHESNTFLPKSFEAKSNSITLSGGIESWRLIDLASKNNIVLKSSTHISYKSPIVYTVSTGNLEKTLLSTPKKSCYGRILSSLFQTSTDDISTGVPWIITTVIYAHQNITFISNSIIDSKSKLDFKARSKKINANLEPEFFINANGIAISFSDKEMFPVAWKPAYISKKHYEKLKQYEERGFFRIIADALFNSDRVQDVLRGLQSDFPDLYKKPKEIIDDMTEGTPIALDEKHLEYLANIDLLLAASWELYPEGE